MEAFKGVFCVHVVDYGIMCGIQWPYFIYMMSQCPKGPHPLCTNGI
jgi:hypothetical protein